jgi:chromosome partitioning protein
MRIFCIRRSWQIIKYHKKYSKIHNPDLDIEGLLLTMYDSRLRLSNQVVRGKHFNDMVFDTIIQRNG